MSRPFLKGEVEVVNLGLTMKPTDSNDERGYAQYARYRVLYGISQQKKLLKDILKIYKDFDLAPKFVNISKLNQLWGLHKDYLVEANLFEAIEVTDEQAKRCIPNPAPRLHRKLSDIKKQIQNDLVALDKESDELLEFLNGCNPIFLDSIVKRHLAVHKAIHKGDVNDPKYFENARKVMYAKLCDF